MIALRLAPALLTPVGELRRMPWDEALLWFAASTGMGK